MSDGRMLVRWLLCLAIVLTVAACTTPGEPAEAPPPEAPTATEPMAPESPSVAPPAAPAALLEPAGSVAPAAVNPWAEAARQVLLPHCGQCHDGERPTSLPRAKAIYDLSEAIWYARVAPQQYDGMLRRVRGHAAITDTDKSVIESFVRCARDNDCAAN